MEKLNKLIENHQNILDEKSRWDKSLLGKINNRLSFLNNCLIGFGLALGSCLTGILLVESGNEAAGAGVVTFGPLAILIASFIFAYFAGKNEISEKEKVEILNYVNQLSKIEGSKGASLKLVKIIDNKMPREWWERVENEVVDIINKDREKNKARELSKIDLINIIEENESVSIKKETVFEDRI